MVCDHDKARCKVAFKPTIWQLVKLVAYALVAAYVHFGSRPPLGHGEYEEGHLSFGPDHIAVIEVSVYDVERCSKILSWCNAVENSLGQGGNFIGLDVRKTSKPEVRE